MKLKLDDVTLCAADCASPGLALRAIERTRLACDFRRAILFTDVDLDTKGVCDLVRIDPLRSSVEYSYFLMKRLLPFLETSHVLVIQWDGFVTEPRAWRNDFLRYDYIGAKWEWHRDGRNVGNGGFSLRSRRLVEAVASVDFAFVEKIPEDEQICRVHRDTLESKYGIQFADERTAEAFSYERAQPATPTFGFHGLFNLWRHLEDEDVIELVDQLDPRNYKSREYAELMAQYYVLRKFRMVEELYRRMARAGSSSALPQMLVSITKNAEFARLFPQLCEELISPTTTNPYYPSG